MKKLILILNVIVSPSNISTRSSTNQNCQYFYSYLKKLIFLVSILGFVSVYAQNQSVRMASSKRSTQVRPHTPKTLPDSVCTIIGSLVSSTTHVTRSAKLDLAAKHHAEYLVKNKIASHNEEDRPLFKTSMDRAKYFGDTGGLVFEVLWASTIFNPQMSDSAAIYRFKKSDTHWNMMTDSTGDHLRFGYCRISTEAWSVCVIIYSYGTKYYNFTTHR